LPDVVVWGCFVAMTTGKLFSDIKVNGSWIGNLHEMDIA